MMRSQAWLESLIVILSMLPICTVMGLSASETLPPYAPLDAAPNAQIWNISNDSSTPARVARLGGSRTGFSSVVSVAGTFHSDEGKDALLRRFGAVSQLPTVSYWSTTEQRWRPLILAATAIAESATGKARDDFSSAELESGRELYLSQTDSRSGKEVAYRMRVIESTSRGFIVQTENVTPVRWSLLTVYQPGDLRSLYFLEQAAPGIWSYYSLTRVACSQWLVTGHENSYINRVVALYRHFAGIPTELEPPPAL